MDRGDDAPPAYAQVAQAGRRGRRATREPGREVLVVGESRPISCVRIGGCGNASRSARGRLFPSIISSSDDDNSEVSDDWMGNLGRRWGFPGGEETRLTSRCRRMELLWMKIEYLEGVVAGLVEAEDEDYSRGVNVGSRMLELERQMESLNSAGSALRGAGRAPRGAGIASLIPGRGDGMRRIVCWTCGQEGHLKADCPRVGVARASQLSHEAAASGLSRCARQGRVGMRSGATFPRGRVLCWSCGSADHCSRECPQVTGQGRPSWGNPTQWRWGRTPGSNTQAW